MLKRKYEIMFILDPIDYNKTKEELTLILTSNKCEVETEEELGIKTLAYPIKKQNKGFYYLANVIANPSSLKELNHDIRLNENILKYICLIYNDKKIKSGDNRSQTRYNPKYDQKT